MTTPKEAAALTARIGELEAELATAKKKMTVAEAGRLGGLEVAKRGREFFREIGRKGGAAVKKSMGPEFFRAIGRKGGYAARNKHGLEFYEEIGRKGGETSRLKRGTEHYRQMGKASAAKRKADAP